VVNPGATAADNLSMVNRIISIPFGSVVRVVLTAALIGIAIFAAAQFAGIPSALSLKIAGVAFALELMLGLLVFLAIRRTLRRAALAGR
jgi:hypothetical protein